MIRPFLDRSLVFDDDILPDAPFVAAYEGEHLMGGTGMNIYAQAILEPVPHLFSVYRSNGVYVDPDTNEILGFAAMHLGDAKLIHTGAPAKLMLTDTSRAVNPGDRLLPQIHTDFNSFFIPQAPEAPVHGHVIEIVDAMDVIGTNQVTVIDRGAADGLKPGDVLAIFKPGHLVRNPMHKRTGLFHRIFNSDAIEKYIPLPDERIGEIMIFRAFSRVSFGLVMDAKVPVKRMDLVSNP